MLDQYCGVCGAKIGVDVTWTRGSVASCLGLDWLLIIALDDQTRSADTGKDRQGSVEGVSWSHGVPLEVGAMRKRHGASQADS